MRAAAVAVLALLAAPAVADQQIFAAWKALNAKSYASADEETLRYAIFKANLDRINAHNAKGETYTMAMNEFGDLTPREFAAARIGGYKPRKLRRHNPNNIVASKPSLVGAPTSVDWRTKGAVTPVKNQGQCGSCWSFSTTGSVEGAGKIYLGSLVSLSEQMLVDCSGSYGNQGCNGGLMDDAFQYIIANGGLCSEAAYPYTAQDGTCQSSSCSLVPSSKITGYQDVSSGSESALVAAAAQQPVSVAVEADQSAWQFYSGGVVTSNCGTNLDHGVLVVGYAAPYYIVKNSWGASWGEAGYIRIGRNGDGNGVCGIQMQPSYPTA